MKIVYDVLIYKAEDSDWSLLFATLQHFPQFRYFDCSGAVDCAKKSLFDIQPDLVLFDAELLDSFKYEALKHFLHEIHWPVQVALITNSVTKVIGEQIAVSLQAKEVPLDEVFLNQFFWSIIQSQHKKHLFILNSFGYSTERILNQTLLVPTLTGFRTIHLSEVCYFEYRKEQRSWFMYGIDNIPTKLRRETNSDTLLEIAPHFVRINQKQIINPEMLIRIVNKKCILKAPYNEENVEFIVSRDCQKSLKYHFVSI